MYFLCILSFLLMARGRTTSGWLIFGFAAGLKLTALPVALPLMAMAYRRASWRALLTAPAAIAAFVISNPVLLRSPQTFMKAVSIAASPFAINISTASRLLLSRYWEWDGIASGGLFAHGIALPAIALLRVAFVREIRRAGPARIVCYGFLLMWCATIVLNFRERFTIWYTFPCIALTPFAVLSLASESRRPITLAVCCQIVCAAPVIFEQYTSKVRNAVELADYSRTGAEVRAILNGWSPDTVADDAVVGRLSVETGGRSASRSISPNS